MSKEKNANCSVCLQKLETDGAAVLTMGHYGSPRLLCPSCEELVDTALKSRDTDAAEAAMARLGETVSSFSIDDTAVTEAVEQIFKGATERIKKIKSGEYDFSLDEQTDEGGFDEIPEELLETEEDKKKTEREDEANRKFNKVMDVVTGAVFAAAVVLLVLFFFLR